MYCFVFGEVVYFCCGGVCVDVVDCVGGYVCVLESELDG